MSNGKKKFSDSVGWILLLIVLLTVGLASLWLVRDVSRTDKAANGTKTQVTAVADKAKDDAGKVVVKVKKAAEKAADTTKKAVAEAKEAAKAAANEAEKAATTAKNATKEAAKAAAETAKSATETAETAKNAAVETKDAAKTAAQNAAETAKSAADKAVASTKADAEGAKSDANVASGELMHFAMNPKILAVRVAPSSDPREDYRVQIQVAPGTTSQDLVLDESIVSINPELKDGELEAGTIYRVIDREGRVFLYSISENSACDDAFASLCMTPAPVVIPAPVVEPVAVEKPAPVAKKPVRVGSKDTQKWNFGKTVGVAEPAKRPVVEPVVVEKPVVAPVVVDAPVANKPVLVVDTKDPAPVAVEVEPKKHVAPNFDIRVDDQTDAAPRVVITDNNCLNGEPVVAAPVVVAPVEPVKTEIVAPAPVREEIKVNVEPAKTVELPTPVVEPKKVVKPRVRTGFRDPQKWTFGKVCSPEVPVRVVPAKPVEKVEAPVVKAEPKLVTVKTPVIPEVKVEPVVVKVVEPKVVTVAPKQAVVPVVEPKKVEPVVVDAPVVNKPVLVVDSKEEAPVVVVVEPDKVVAPAACGEVLPIYHRGVTFAMKEAVVTPVLETKNGNGYIAVIVPSDTDVTNLVPIMTAPEGYAIDPQPNVARDFTNPVNFVITTPDEGTFNLEVEVVRLDPKGLAKQPKPKKEWKRGPKAHAWTFGDIVSMDGGKLRVREAKTVVLEDCSTDDCVETVDMNMNEAVKTPVVVMRGNDVYATVVVGPKTDVTHLVPRFALSKGVTISPDPKIARDFTTPQTYRVRTTKGVEFDYTIEVIKLKPVVAEGRCTNCDVTDTKHFDADRYDTVEEAEDAFYTFVDGTCCPESCRPRGVITIKPQIQVLGGTQENNAGINQAEIEGAFDKLALWKWGDKYNIMGGAGVGVGLDYFPWSDDRLFYSVEVTPAYFPRTNHNGKFIPHFLETSFGFGAGYELPIGRKGFVVDFRGLAGVVTSTEISLATKTKAPISFVGYFASASVGVGVPIVGTFKLVPELMAKVLGYIPVPKLGLALGLGFAFDI